MNTRDMGDHWEVWVEREKSKEKGGGGKEKPVLCLSLAFPRQTLGSAYVLSVPILLVSVIHAS